MQSYMFSHNLPQGATIVEVLLLHEYMRGECHTGDTGNRSASIKSMSVPQSSKAPLACFECGGPHFARNCPERARVAKVPRSASSAKGGGDGKGASSKYPTSKPKPSKTDQKCQFFFATSRASSW